MKKIGKIWKMEKYSKNKGKYRKIWENGDK